MPTTMVDRYLGFVIEATYYHSGHGYMPTVVVRKRRDDGVKEMQLTPPGPERGYDTEEKVFEVGIDYAKRVIEGRVPGVDVSEL